MTELLEISRRSFYTTIPLLAIIVLSMASFVTAGTGNGAPSGYHFELNIIGAKTSNCPQTDGSGGSSIFVGLGSAGVIAHSEIDLKQGTTFYVLDNNACIDGTAQFQLPLPINVATGATAYTVWARVQGIPKGTSTLTTCGTDTTGTLICSLGKTIGTRDLKQHFHDVTSLLTTVCGVINGVTQCVPIFNSALTNYYWSYDNQGNKVLQLRFYPTS